MIRKILLDVCMLNERKIERNEKSFLKYSKAAYEQNIALISALLDNEGLCCKERKNENGGKKNRGRRKDPAQRRFLRRNIAQRSIKKSSNASGWKVSET